MNNNDDCEVCAHPQREEIEFYALRSGLSNDNAANEFGVHGQSLRLRDRNPNGRSGWGGEAVRLHRSSCMNQEERDLIFGRVEAFTSDTAIIDELRRRRQEA